MSETCLERWMRQPHFTCPHCGITSWNLSDVRHQYCGRCHTFFGQKRDYVRNRAPSYGAFAERPHRTEPARYSSEPIRRRDDDSPFPAFPSVSWDPAPPTAPPDPPAFEPGGGSSGGGGASGDY
jgi:hypothetical protein